MSSRVSYQIVDEIGVITVDNPPVNALSQAVRQGLLDAIREAQTDASRAVLIHCEGRTFIAGADITEFGKPPVEPYLPSLLNEIEASRKLVVAALHGTALGGGLETALASHYRIALDSAKVGLPEVNLGLLPGAGGTQRVPRLAGIEAALDLIVSGAPIPASRAAEIGLVDKVASGDVLDEAIAYVHELLEQRAPIRRTSELDVTPVNNAVFDDYRKNLAKKARSQTAPQRIVDCIEAASTLSFEAGLKTERELFMECMRDPQSASLQYMFFAEREAAKVRGMSRDTARRDIKTVGIIGGGTMGGGIAMSFANAGIPVTLIEINDEALERGLSIVDKNYAGSVKRGKLSEDKAASCRRLITGATDYGALADADLVIEAVFEDPNLKKEIFARLDATCKPGAILATNTSYQDVNAIAAATNRPESVLGMHFFSPANIMKLLEVVRADKTADDVLATVMALAKRIRKVAVVSGVCYGFIGNRMLQGYFREAQLCLIEGGTAESIDAAMYDWGMAMGPISVADLAGLDVGYKARQALPEDQRGDPRSYRVPDALVEMDRLGQKSGAGFYSYDPATRKKSSDPTVLEVVEREAKQLGIDRHPITADEIVDRLIYALVNEGLGILEEGIAQRPSDIDVVYVYGYGFPAWRGGPMHYADSVGLDTVLARIKEFGERFGEENWTPAPLLEKLVAEKSTIAEFARNA
ncbi:MAG: 3-hydroxyacyl-CoA dehydrogenase NAD-binding domain-containing protein [Gammaproteobacteria bacterium]|nr:3-hydroxyacyl-CoA dehydrogenase NAD-binding domain-containing protein [Gammaproteobacteria bacterium]